MKFYQKAIMQLDKSDRYDLSPTKLKGFLDNVREKADIYGWKAVLQIPKEGAIPAVNMLNSYGQVSLAECAAHATVYMMERTRNAQNASIMYPFLLASLTPEAR
jgi:hypothetical protein